MTNETKPSLKKANAFAKFSSVGIQMGLLIYGGVYLGQYLDERYGFETPWMTILFALIGVFLGLFFVIREVIKMGKNK